MMIGAEFDIGMLRVGTTLPRFIEVYHSVAQGKRYIGSALLPSRHPHSLTGPRPRGRDVESDLTAYRHGNGGW